MFTLNLKDYQSANAGPPPPPNPPTESCESSPRRARPKSKIPVSTRSRSRSKSRETDKESSKNDTSFYPFSLIRDYAKSRFTSEKPPLPSKSTVGTMASPPKTTSACVATSNHDWSFGGVGRSIVTDELPRPKSSKNIGCCDSESFRNRLRRSEELIINSMHNFKSSQTMDRPNNIGSNSLLSTLGGLFQPNEVTYKPLFEDPPTPPLAPNGTQQASHQKDMIYRNMHYGHENDVCSSGVFLLNRDVMSMGEAPKNFPQDVLTYRPQQPTIFEEKSQSNVPSEFSSVAGVNELNSVEAIRQIQKALNESMKKSTVGVKGEIPNEIQDDMLRIEMLLELRKYKRALSAQLQAHQRLIHMCSDQNLSGKQLKSGESKDTRSEFAGYLQSMMDGDMNGGDKKKDEDEDKPIVKTEPEKKKWESELASQILDLSAAIMEPNLVGRQPPLGPTLNPLLAEINQHLSSTTHSSLSSDPSVQDQFLVGNCRILEGLDNFNPNSGFRLSSRKIPTPVVQTIAPEAGLLDLLRRPVAVAKQKSPPQTDSPPTRAPELASFPYGDKPSPFFPGFTGEIDMKIKSPEELKAYSGTAYQQNVDELEELGNLLSQLPVISRQELVKDFAKDDNSNNEREQSTPNSLAATATEADSYTSMIPQVSSAGTTEGEVGHEETDDQTTEEEMEDQVNRELKEVDTTRLSIGELVTLGRKIYKILSELNTAAVHNDQEGYKRPHSQSQAPPSSAPYSYDHYNNNPSPPPVKEKSQSATNPHGMFYLNSVPHQTYVTGPGMVQIHSSSFGRTMSASKPPISIRKFLQQPQTTSRWDRDDERNSRSPSNRREDPVKKAYSNRPGSYVQYPGKSRKHGSGLIEDRSIMIPTSPRNSEIRNRYRHYIDYRSRDYEPVPLRKKHYSNVHEYRENKDRMSNYSSGAKSPRRNFIQENIMKAKLMRKMSERSTINIKPLPPIHKKYENIQSVVGSRSRSGERSRTPRALERTRSASIPKTRETSISRHPPGKQMKLGIRRTGSVSSQRTSTAQSEISVSSRRSRRPSSPPEPPTPNLFSRSYLGFEESQLLLEPPTRQPKSLASKKSSVTKTKLTKAAKLPPPVSIPNVASLIAAAAATPYKSSGMIAMASKSNSMEANYPRTNSSANVVARKSRSKTKKESMIANEYKKSSVPVIPTDNSKFKMINKGKTSSKTANAINTASSAVANMINGITQGIAIVKGSGSKIQNKQKSDLAVRKVKAQRSMVIGDPDMFENSSPKTGSQIAFNSPSEQELIREMVKAEMNLMVEKHVKDVLSKKMSEGMKKEGDGDGQYGKRKSIRKRSSSEPLHSEESDIDNFTPVYTPPKVMDESLFALERWINPEGNVPRRGSTTEKDSPTRADGSDGGGGSSTSKKSNKQSVRFKIPQDT